MVMRIIPLLILLQVCPAFAWSSRQQQDEKMQQEYDQPLQTSLPVGPTALIKVGYDYDQDGQIDAHENIFVYDSEQSYQGILQRFYPQALGGQQHEP